MRAIKTGDLLWTPSQAVIETSNLERYRRWLAAGRGVDARDYWELWRWSIEHIEDFWAGLIDFFNVPLHAPWTTPLVERVMPGARWFPGATLNYAEVVLGRIDAALPVILYTDERDAALGVIHSLSRADLVDQVGRAAAALRALGVGPGDRVVGYLPNIPEAIVALLACASLGAIWSSCSPDFGARAVLDRFSQIAPKVLIAVTGYQYGGAVHDRRDVLRDLLVELPDLKQALILPFDDLAFTAPGVSRWVDALAAAAPDLRFEAVPFDHPLWILYSSGTTGLPKPIVHGHGGIVLEHLKEATLHNDLKPGDRFFWYTSTGWMMWNYLVGGLLTGATILVYNGSPGYPDMNALFRLAERTGMTYFGTSAAFIHACMKADIHPGRDHDLSALRVLGSTGSPLSVEGFGWVYERVNPALALESFSGGTDLCTGFVGGVRTLPIYAGELQAPSLGAAVYAFDEAGQPVIDQVGELVITQPMPSMPLYFWGDDAAMTRYRASYFDVYPGVWRHGDWIQFNARGGAIIYGRSDATINRQGIRMGTAELYRVVEAFPEVLDSLIVDLELLGRPSRLLLFVVLREGVTLTDDLTARIKDRLRAEISPRHVPDAIVPIPEVPYTLSGKKMEVPIRKILLGLDVDAAARRGAMRNPGALDFFIAYAQMHTGQQSPPASGPSA
ncbi:MAG: acetoacetate--CoA ligase [Anaerolinea sp.]|nr:acetoacetate--CoA ligase [Anaerolinea sp.]